jgi:anti-sigma-K factor RskA
MKTKIELPDALEALLPWYATGRLSAEDRARVAKALESREDLAMQLRLIEEDRDATIRLNEDLGSPGDGVWDRIAAVAAPEPRRLALGARISRWLGLEVRLPHSRLAWVAAAVAIVAALQSAAIFTLLPSSSGPRGYQTASAPAAIATGAQALVAFTPDARLDQVGALLAETRGTIVDGPRGGFYKIRFGDGPLDKPALEALLAKLRATGIVKMALPAAAGG